LTTSISSPNMRIGFEACVCARGHASVPQNVSGVQARLKRMEHVLNVLLVHHHRP
jgi:hypothetical protein